MASLSITDHVLGKRDLPTGRLLTQERVPRSATKEQPARHDVVVGDENLRVKLEIWYRVDVGFQHRPVVAQGHALPVVRQLIGYELPESRPLSLVKHCK